MRDGKLTTGGTFSGDSKLTTTNIYAITLDVREAITGKPDRRVKLLSVAPGVVKNGTTFTVIGAESTSRAYFDEARGGIVLYSPSGIVIISR